MSVGELLISSTTSWKTFVLIVFMLGFLPGFTLRLLVRGYPKDDPRREELVAELYVLPYWRRPLWVAQQLETVLFDGVFPRIHWVLTGRIILRWRLTSGVRMNRRHRATFEIPTAADKATIEPGALVKLMFTQSDDWCERMWVRVTNTGRFRWAGELINEPYGGFPRLNPGSRIKFRPKHIIAISADCVCEVPREITLIHHDCAGRHPLHRETDQVELPPAST